MNGQQLDLFSLLPSESRLSEDLGIEGLIYAADLLDRNEQAEMLRQVDSMPWRADLKRRVQHYGYRYDYKARKVDCSMYLGDLPVFAKSLAERLVVRGLYPKLPDQLIVNEYQPGQGISAHIDCEPCFSDTIAMVSLGWAYEMDYIHARTRDVKSLLLEPGSALVIAGEARYDWLHQIRARRSDRGVERKRRVSLTFRNVILEPQADRQVGCAPTGQ